MNPRVASQFHLDEIRRLLSDDEHINAATSASVLSATEAMEKGMSSRLFPTRSALRVFQMAGADRQKELKHSNRWVTACLVESLASIRLLSIKNPEMGLDYSGIRDQVFSGIEQAKRRKRNRKMNTSKREMPEGPWSVPKTIQLGDGTYFSSIDPRKGMTPEQIAQWIRNDPNRK